MAFYFAALGSLFLYSGSKYFPLRNIAGSMIWLSSVLFPVSLVVSVRSYGAINGSLIFVCLLMLFPALVQVLLHLPRVYQYLSVAFLHLFLLLSLI